MKKLTALILVLALSAALLMGCTVSQETAEMVEEGAQVETLAQLNTEPAPAGGVLCLKVNPEIALHYDENGKITKLEGRNEDGNRILEGVTDYAGKDTVQVLEELVNVIGKAGYFVEEADGTARRIVLELDPGSQVPHEQFLQDMAQHVKSCVERKNWAGEQEYDYPEPTTAASAEPAPVAPVAATPSGTGSTVCPVCYDDDCDDGKYCDDWDDRAENAREAENRENGVRCQVCGDYDCDDGKYCDDWDDRYEHDDDDDDRDHDRHHDDDD